MIVSLLYYVHYVYRPVLVTVLAKQLRINPRGHVDVSALANLEQVRRKCYFYSQKSQMKIVFVCAFNIFFIFFLIMEGI